VVNPARRPQPLPRARAASQAGVVAADPAPLYAIAAELDRRAGVLHARAVLIGTAPARTRWSSVGARLWADGVAQIGTTLVRSAGQVEQAAARLRASAVEVCSWE